MPTLTQIFVEPGKKYQNILYTFEYFKRMNEIEDKIESDSVPIAWLRIWWTSMKTLRTPIFHFWKDSTNYLKVLQAPFSNIHVLLSTDRIHTRNPDRRVHPIFPRKSIHLRIRQTTHLRRLLSVWSNASPYGSTNLGTSPRKNHHLLLSEQRRMKYQSH